MNAELQVQGFQCVFFINSDITLHSENKLSKYFLVYICECMMKVMIYDESDEAFCTGGNVQLESSKRISVVDLVYCWS